MSHEAQKRVFEHSQTRGTHRLVMLALAFHVRDERSICWPSAETIAAMINEEVSYTRRLLAEVVTTGEIVKQKGGGRGISTIYGVAVGLGESARAALVALLPTLRVKGGVLLPICGNADENSVPEYTVLENSVPEYSVLSSQKQYTTVHVAETTSSAPPSPKPAQKTCIMNHDHDHDDDGVGAHDKKTDTNSIRSRPKAQPRHVTYLAGRGMGAAHLFVNLDPDAAIADFDARIADGWSIATIVTTWKTSPPAPGRIYGRQDEANTAKRSVAAEHGSGSRPSRRPPRPGERGYYRGKAEQ